MKRLVAAPAWADYVVSPFGPLSATSDNDIDDYIRGISSGGLHAVGTAAMSSSNSPHGVVDQNLLVKGADGLRIVDASVFVSIIDTDLHMENQFIPIHSLSSPVPIHKARSISWLRGLLILSRYGAHIIYRRDFIYQLCLSSYRQAAIHEL